MNRLGVSQSYDLMMSHRFGCNQICVMSIIKIGVYESLNRIRLHLNWL